ncbi:MAG: hypothetical protein COV66_10475 [Nitrospinae bacterium CG11_big_fil_rev_8_21_14_0_20_45_15]|nr:MAG: hypothetical protein COV66_10475 [Nitrospinae bacterium CG11_big_fil_rev_8_21_14_0_20_45_15]
MLVINKDTPINAIISAHPETIRFFGDLKMSCGECFAVNFDTLENGALMHGMDVNNLLLKLTEFLQSLPASVPTRN